MGKKRTTKEQLIRKIVRDTKVDYLSVKIVYRSLEDLIYQLLEEVNQEQDAEIKLFDGMTVEGKYIPHGKKINNITGNEIEYAARIRPHVKVSRRCSERINHLV